MKTSTARRLLRLNREFYDRFSSEFAISRPSCQPGARRALELLPHCRSILDVGCGDGRVARALASGEVMEGVARYCGVDSSSGFLARARESGLPRSRFEFIEADLSTAGWMKSPAVGARPFEAAVCFAVLFHIPGARRRLRLLREMHDLLVDGGRAAVGIWQFLHLEKFRERIVPWEEVGLTASAVDAGDLLLDWRRGGRGLRYVHHFDPGELAGICRRAGFAVHESFRDDGKTGDMSLYLMLEKI